ncbi:MAG: hypothetical protein Fur0022_32070 [Anaerolineales bacterium]
MNINVFILTLFITATITLAFALRSWQKGGWPTIYFSLLLASLAIGMFSYCIELWVPTEAGKFIWFLIKYAGLTSSASFWWIFTLQFTEKPKWGRAFHLGTLAIGFVIIFVLFMTTRQHGWLFQNLHVRENFLVFDFGPFFWAYLTYIYFLFTAGFIQLFHWLRKNDALQLPQWAGAIFGLSLPLIISLMTLLQFPIHHTIDLTLPVTTLSFLLVRWILFGLNFASGKPIAHEMLFESLKDGVIVIDPNEVITDVNPATLQLLLLKQSPLGMPIKAVITTPITLPSPDASDTYPHQEIAIPSAGIHPRMVDLRASPLVDKSHHLRGWLLLLRDITEQKRLQTELKKQSLRNAALAEIELAINQPHELAGVLQKIVNTTYELLPAPGGVTILIWNEETHTFENADSTLPAKELNHLLARAKQGYGSAPWIISHKQPKIVPNTSAEPFGEHDLLAGNKIMAYVGLPLIVNAKVVGVLYANDIKPRTYTEDDLHFLQTLANRAASAIYRVQQFSQVQQQAITDHLTGIFNRRQLFNLGELEFRRARRFNRPLSTIMLDIDHFKNINDTYGHAKGDQVLKSLAQFLKIHLRDFDILGRYGGEEFVIVLPGADLENARNVAARLHKGVQERPMINGSVSITVSLGVAELSTEVPDFYALMNKADMAMYQAKRAGRNRVAWL